MKIKNNRELRIGRLTFKVLFYLIFIFKLLIPNIDKLVNTRIRFSYGFIRYLSLLFKCFLLQLNIQLCYTHVIICVFVTFSRLTCAVKQLALHTWLDSLRCRSCRMVKGEFIDKFY